MLQVGTDLIFRGPRLGLDQGAWDEMKRAGVKTVLNLERGYFEWFHGQLNKEVCLASVLGLTPVHLQLGDILPPTSPDLFCALGIVKDAMKVGGVYIHCLHGVDRTGMVCAMIRRYLHQWSASDAIAEMLKLGFHEFPYRNLGWIKRLEHCLK